MSRQQRGHIVVFGAGGRAGRTVVGQALRRGRRVVGVVRDPRGHPDLADDTDAGLRIVAGDLTDPASAAAVVTDETAALVNAVTPFTAPPDSFDDFDTAYYAHLVGNLVRAAGTSGARVVEIGLAATLKSGDGRLYDDADAFPAFLRPFAEARMRGLAAWREASDQIDWLVVTPPPLLSPQAPPTGRYRLAGDILDSTLAAVPLSYTDLATAIVDQIDSPTHHRSQIAVYAAP
ncbi:NAD(P)-dependent oxidoreductase [Nocardia sp. BMG51109]|uniref:NAD(P)-dependent oxidoreductase n=1 Tax=Nocardia sp. BMG51109 TaxID=1056816 RepID=UPI00046747FA|nr:NAD(P)H-binding protein [Nocardia sp. BMG51109]